MRATRERRSQRTPIETPSRYRYPATSEPSALKTIIGSIPLTLHVVMGSISFAAGFALELADLKYARLRRYFQSHRADKSTMTHRSSLKVRDSVRRLERETNSNAYGLLAGNLYQQFLRGERIPTDKLRSIFVKTGDDTKRSCILQLLAQIGDSKALPYFLNEIQKGAHANGRRPNSSLITAIAHVRLLRIPDSQMEGLVANIQACATKLDNTTNSALRKQLITGALVSVGVLGTLESSYSFVAKLLEDSDGELAEEAAEALMRIWNRAGKKDPQAQTQYRIPLSSYLHTWLMRHVNDRGENGQGIPSSEIIVAQLLPFLIQVDASQGKSILSLAIKSAVAEHNTFLQGAITTGIRALPEPLRMELLNDLSDSKLPQDSARVFDFILG